MWPWLCFRKLEAYLISLIRHICVLICLQQQGSESQTKTQQEEGGDDVKEEEDEEHDDTLCGVCGVNYTSDEFWICCDVCEIWFHGKCVKITPAKEEHIKQYKCPSCSNKRGNFGGQQSPGRWSRCDVATTSQQSTASPFPTATTGLHRGKVDSYFSNDLLLHICPARVHGEGDQQGSTSSPRQGLRRWQDSNVVRFGNAASFLFSPGLYVNNSDKGSGQTVCLQHSSFHSP